MEHTSLDGVIQHSADDDDFPYGDWTAPYRTPAGRDAVLAAQSESFDLLLGRRTYDIWFAIVDKPVAALLPTHSEPLSSHRRCPCIFIT
jgi:dihydrofolate reductase